jgi:hypothetical protein
MSLFQEYPIRSAKISECGRYRWWLRREWRRIGDTYRKVCFVMLNPSTADAEIDDPTIRRCMGFTQAWEFDILEVRNLFSFRATNPKELLVADDPIGTKGDEHLQKAKRTNLLIAAWGTWVPFDREREALEMLSNKDIHCLEKTKNGSPKHPLYCSADLKPVLFKRAR